VADRHQVTAVQLAAATRLGRAVHGHPAGEQELFRIRSRVRKGRQLEQLAEADHIARDFDLLHFSIVACTCRAKTNADSCWGPAGCVFPLGRPAQGRSARPAHETPGMPYVYLLRCADDSLYCGWTTDIQRRLAAHRAGTASRYTRSRSPIELAAVVPVADRSAALREEARIKRLPRVAKLQLTDRLLKLR
jgi:putative endonuclease